MADSPIKSSEETSSDDQRVEQLAKELADRLRAMPNRAELTDYAVSMLRESAEEADQSDLAHDSADRLRKGESFNPIAFAIPLFVVGAVLCATGILIGPGVGIIGVAILMAVFGLVHAMFRGALSGRGKAGKVKT